MFLTHLCLYFDPGRGEGSTGVWLKSFGSILHFIATIVRIHIQYTKVSVIEENFAVLKKHF